MAGRETGTAKRGYVFVRTGLGALEPAAPPEGSRLFPASSGKFLDGRGKGPCSGGQRVRVHRGRRLALLHPALLVGTPCPSHRGAQRLPLVFCPQCLKRAGFLLRGLGFEKGSLEPDSENETAHLCRPQLRPEPGAVLSPCPPLVPHPPPPLSRLDTQRSPTRLHLHPGRCPAEAGAILATSLVLCGFQLSPGWHSRALM